jgi:phenylpropionate dioxygenase-like ring-hydroxylating dioxygenase large terminal subunit
MLLPQHRRLLDDLRHDIASGAPRLDDAPEFRVPVERYLSPERLESERSLLRRVPLIVAHASELAEADSCLRVDALGISAIVVRGRDGELSAFLNACRHRGTQLVEATCKRKAFVCPYHGWTYDLAGRLIHIPHEQAFAGIDRREHGLVALPVTSAYGFVWLTLSPEGDGDVKAWVGPLAPDLEAFAFGDHVVFRRSTALCQANWKLLVEAFLENYHLRHLHRDTLSSFFLDAYGAVAADGPHIRALTARRALLEADGEPDLAALRVLTSPSFFLFPNTIVVVHPDYLSHLAILPEGVDRLRCVLTMCVPSGQADDAHREHWERSFALIDGGVFAGEDYRVAEKMQAGIATGANRHLTFGRMEHAVRHFHQALDAAIQGAVGSIGAPGA